MDKQIWAEVVTIGSELVLGQLVDTNASYIAQALSEIGLGMAYHTTVGDDRERMLTAFRTALERCHVVIATGGIGPTEDDLTREVAAQVMGTELELREDLLEYIESLFKRMGYQMADNNRRQAYIPKGAAPIHNPRGTAPAFRCEINDRVLICLPGVPFETEPLLREEILPYLEKKYSPKGRVWVNRVLKVCGLGESSVDAQIKEIILSSRNPTIGLQAAPGEIKVRLTARADNRLQAEGLLDEGEARIREKIGSLIFGYGDETLSGNTVRLIEESGKTLAVGDALTGGLVISELGGRLSRSSFKGGNVLNREIPASELCDRLIRDFQADLALAIAGFPGEDDKHRIEIRVRDAEGREKSRELLLGGPDRLVKTRAAIMALFTLFSFLRDL